MADILSQNQIDDLLKRMQGGGAEPVVEETSRVKEYDFTSPKKFTKDQLKSLNNLYETFSRLIASYFTGILRDLVEINIVQIEEQRYNEFNNALPDNTLVVMLDFRPEEQLYDETVVMIEFSQTFGYMVIERLMGAMSDIFIPSRDYTDIELAILRSVMERVSTYLKDAWEDYIQVQTDLRSIETNGRLIQAFTPQDIVVIITLEITCGTISTTANICMPSENLDAVIASFGLKYARASSKHQAPEREQMRRDLVFDYIKQSDLVVEAILDKCEMTYGEVLALQVNDIISLNKQIDSDIAVTVDGIPWYQARLGESRTKKAIKLTDTFAK